MAAQDSSRDVPTPDDDKTPLFDIDIHEDNSEDSDGISLDDLPEFITVNLVEVRKVVECPICLGIMRKTIVIRECLHRFCGECIDQAMRMGKKECPVCRAHCAGLCSLLDDPDYDAVIAALYTDIDKYEAEELEFDEEEKARNEQIQATIAETSRRQSEANERK